MLFLSETGFCLRFHVEPTQLDPISRVCLQRASLCYWTETETTSICRVQSSGENWLFFWRVQQSMYFLILTTETDPVSKTLCLKYLKTVDSVQNNSQACFRVVCVLFRHSACYFETANVALKATSCVTTRASNNLLQDLPCKVAQKEQQVSGINQNMLC
jgi:hypothetical protein